MFCPKCRYEYVPGRTTCPDCGVELVDQLPPEAKGQPNDIESESVYVSFDRMKTVLAKSILDNAGIEYVNVPAFNWRYEYKLVFRVSKENAAKARELLADIENMEPLRWDETGMDWG